LTDLPDFTLDKDVVRGLLTFMAWVLVVGSFAYRILQLLLFGAIAKRFAAPAGARLSYGSALRIAAVAMTPAILLDTALGIIGNPIPLWSLCCLGLTLAYLRFGASSLAPLEQVPALASMPASRRAA
jgi:hypothetical protein